MSNPYRYERQMNQKDQTKILLDYCEKNDIEVTDIQPWQLRLSLDEKVIDIYPQRKRFHIITCNARGEYEDLLKFLGVIYNL
jgi:hypothetical protein